MLLKDRWQFLPVCQQHLFKGVVAEVVPPHLLFTDAGLLTWKLQVNSWCSGVRGVLFCHISCQNHLRKKFKQKDTFSNLWSSINSLISTVPVWTWAVYSLPFCGSSFVCGQVRSLRPFVSQTFSSFQTPSIWWLSFWAGCAGTWSQDSRWPCQGL